MLLLGMLGAGVVGAAIMWMIIPRPANDGVPAVAAAQPNQDVDPVAHQPAGQPQDQRPQVEKPVPAVPIQEVQPNLADAPDKERPGKVEPPPFAVEKDPLPLPEQEKPHWIACDVPADAQTDVFVRATVNSPSVFNARFSPDGKQLVTVESRGESYLWDLANGTRLAQPIGRSANWQTTVFTFSPDSRQLAVCTNHGSPNMFLMDAKTGSFVRAWNVDKVHQQGVMFSPDSTRLAVVQEQRIEVVDARSGERQTVINVPDATLYCSSFSQDNRILATGGVRQEKGEFRLWDLENSRELLRHGQFEGPVWDVFLSNDLKLAVAAAEFEQSYRRTSDPPSNAWETASNKLAVTTWRFENNWGNVVLDRESGTFMRFVHEPDQPSRYLGFDLGSNPQPNSITVHEASLGDEWQAAANISFPNPRSFLSSLRSNTLALMSGSYNSNSLPSSEWNSAIYDFNSGELKKHFKGGTTAISGVGNYVLASSGEVIDLERFPHGRLRLIGSLQHEGPVTQLGVADDRIAVHVARDSNGRRKGGLEVWDFDVTTRQARLRSKDPWAESPQTSALSDDATWSAGIANVSNTSQVAVFKVGTKRVHIFAVGLPTKSQTCRLAISPDNSRMAIVGTRDLRIAIHSIARQKPDHLFDLDLKPIVESNPSLLRAASMLPYHSALQGLRFSPDAQMLALVATDGAKIVWRLETQEQIPLQPGEKVEIFDADFSPDSRYLAVSGNEGYVEIWDLESGTRHRRFEGLLGQAIQVRFSPDGRRLAAAGTTAIGVAGWIWDVETGAALFPISGHAKRVRRLEFGPPSHNLLVTCDEDGRSNIWDFSSFVAEPEAEEPEAQEAE